MGPVVVVEWGRRDSRITFLQCFGGKVSRGSSTTRLMTAPGETEAGDLMPDESHLFRLAHYVYIYVYVSLLPHLVMTPTLMHLPDTFPSVDG